jgi:hypothetical protein
VVLCLVLARRVSQRRSIVTQWSRIRSPLQAGGKGSPSAPPIIAWRYRSLCAAQEVRLFQRCCDCRSWNRSRPAPGSVALLPSQTSAPNAIERAVNLLAVSTDETAGRRRAEFRFWAGSDDVFHGAIELGTVSGTTSNECARQTVGDLICEMEGARHGVNISFFTFASKGLLRAGSLVDCKASPLQPRRPNINHLTN